MTPAERLEEFQAGNRLAGEDAVRAARVAREAGAPRPSEAESATFDTATPAEPDGEWHPDAPETPWEELLRLEAMRPPEAEEPPFNPYELDDPLVLDLHWIGDEPHEPLMEDRYNVTLTTRES